MGQNDAMRKSKFILEGDFTAKNYGFPTGV